MRHLVFALVIVLYVLAISQNWAVYTAALMLALYVRNGGRWSAPVDSFEFRLGGGGRT